VTAALKGRDRHLVVLEQRQSVEAVGVGRGPRSIHCDDERSSRRLILDLERFRRLQVNMQSDEHGDAVLGSINNSMLARAR
jgi:hypothetical protein